MRMFKLYTYEFVMRRRIPLVNKYAYIHEKIWTMNIPDKNYPTNKISIIGAGQVGMSSAFAILNQGICNELALNDNNEKKLHGECLDLRQGLAFTKNVKIDADKDPKVTAGSNIIVLTAGARQRPEENRLSLVHRNISIFKEIIPDLVKYSPHCIILVVSNPVDILTYATWKLSGLPITRVLGSGTNIDSARFRYYISEKFNISTENCHGWIIGEHGDTSVPVWSSVNVAGLSLKDLNSKVGTDEDHENWKEVHEKVVKSAYETINLKGYTNWAIGLSVMKICSSILNNEKKVFALSTNAKNKLDIKEEVFLSLPCVIDRSGLRSILSPVLSDIEKKKLLKSSQTMYEIQKEIKL